MAKKLLWARTGLCRAGFVSLRIHFDSEDKGKTQSSKKNKTNISLGPFSYFCVVLSFFTCCVSHSSLFLSFRAVLPPSWPPSVLARTAFFNLTIHFTEKSLLPVLEIASFCQGVVI